MQPSFLSSYVIFTLSRRFRPILLAITVLIGASITTVAQSALDGFDPHADEPIHAIVVQPDGKILIGGEFTSLSPNGGAAIPRNHIARLNVDGSIDMGFNPNANGNVYAIALQPTGDIFLGGSFTFINSQPRALIARVNGVTGAPDNVGSGPLGLFGAAVYSIAVQPDGKVIFGGSFNDFFLSRSNLIRFLPNGLFDTGFNASPNNTVRAIALQDNGKIVVGGDFTAIVPLNSPAIPRNFVARLNGVDGIPDYFDPNSNGPVYALAIQDDNKILVGGLYSSIGGQVRAALARLDPLTGLPDTFRANRFISLGQVFALAIQPDCRILVAGDYEIFTTPPGSPPAAHSGLVRVNPDGEHDLTFKLNVPRVYSVAIQSDRKIVFGGAFAGVGSAGQTQTARNCIARYEPSGAVDTTLDINAIGSSVHATALQPDGKILIGGQFTSILGVSRNNIARLNQDGTLDLAFDPNADAVVNSIVVEGDGRILIAGGFANIGGGSRSNLARLDTSGVLDASFNPHPNGFITVIAVQQDGMILVSGGFTNIGGQTRQSVARLDPISGLADSFNPNPNPGLLQISAIAIQRDTKILLGGYFTSIAGQVRNHIVRVDLNGVLDPTFNPSQNNSIGTGVFAIAIQENGTVLIAGDFTLLAGQARNRLARLDANGVLDAVFNPNANNVVFSLAAQTDGKILAGGSFTSIGGQPVRNRIARLNGITGAADSFDPNANNVVRSIMLQADGRLLVGGDFGSAGGQTRSLFARLANDTGALQELASFFIFPYYPSPIPLLTSAWTRSGASPQLSNVEFSFSGDGVNFYSPCGQPNQGTLTGTSWLHDFAFSFTSCSFGSYTRARGYYQGGQVNGSGAIVECVRCFNYSPFPAGRAANDFDGDGRADVSVFRQSNGYWYITQSSNTAFRATPFGTNGDQIVPGDYDGDGKTDTAVFRSSNGYWYILNSSTNTFVATQFGQAGDVPSPGDYDGDGKADVALYRPSNGYFYMLQSSNGSFQFKQWGQIGDIPVMGDYDGDAKTDFAIFRPSGSIFYILRSSDGSFVGQQFGQSGDNPIAADFDGDDKTDIGVYRPASGGWYYRQSKDNAFKGMAWGTAGDIPSPADYDGDGKWDIAVFRPSEGTFYISQSTTNALRVEQFGTNGDVPVPSAFVH